MSVKNRKQITFLAHKEEIPSYVKSSFDLATTRFEHVHNKVALSIKEGLAVGSGEASLRLLDIYLEEVESLMISGNMIKDIIRNHPEEFRLIVKQPKAKPKAKKKTAKKEEPSETLISKANKRNKKED
jgi:hypothetical protein